MKKISMLGIGSIIMGTGIVIGRISKPAKKANLTYSAGNIRIDRSEIQEPPRLFLELTVPFEELETKDTVIFSVINESYISQ